MKAFEAKPSLLHGTEAINVNLTKQFINFHIAKKLSDL
jgi:hypothetical protein